MFFLLIFIASYLYRSLVFLDPDFGWHVKLGELISKNGIYSKDPFSYTMPSFAYIDHEWLINIFFSKAWNLGLGQLLATLFVFLAITSFAIVSFSKKADFDISKLTFFICLASVFPFFGIRPQVISWLLFSLFYYFFLNEKSKINPYFFIPILMILWANLHGSFAIVPVSLFLIFVSKSVQAKKPDKQTIILFFLSLLATGINPYGYRVWEEVWRSVSDTSIRWTIAEWKPSLFIFNPFYLFYVSLFVILLSRIRNLFKTETIVLPLFFLVQSIFSVRHVPFFMLSAAPLILGGLSRVKKEAGNFQLGSDRFSKSLLVATWGTLVFFIVYSFLTGFSQTQKLSENGYYPKGAVFYLEQNPPNGRLFSIYDWGGYLIWKLPDQRVFIDGRMPSWKNPVAPVGESENAMKEYLDIVLDKTDYEVAFEKYGITDVLLNKQTKNWLSKTENSILVFLGINSPVGRSLNERLTEDGWSIVYEDKLSLLYRKVH